MPDIRTIDADFVRLRLDDGRTAVLVFGDRVEVLEEGDGRRRSRVRAMELWDGSVEGTISGAPFRMAQPGVLKFSMIDVQQGDGMVLETPPDPQGRTRLVFIDGGDNKLFARHVAARYWHRRPTEDDPLEVDLVLVTHGDADHFDGLNDIRRSETDSGIADRKRLFVRPHRIYHNGLVKAPTAFRPEDERLGRTVEHDGRPHIIDLYDDPRDAPDERRNRPFGWWVTSLDHWETRGPIEMRRIAHGMDEAELFGFLDPVRVEIQGPFTRDVEHDGETRPALPLLNEPRHSPLAHLRDGGDRGRDYSISHTINGHSIALRLTYGHVRFSLTGDLNQQSMEAAAGHLPDEAFEAEIIKAPHHGSADFDLETLKKMRPVVSLVSSGDESASKEYIHPRATLMAALGKASRGDTGILLCTELAAFFAKRGYSHERRDLADYYEGDDDTDPDETFTRADLEDYFKASRRSWEEEAALPSFYGFERTNFGIIHVRTDGERVLVFTHSGRQGLREAYRFRVDASHEVTFEEVDTR